MLICAGNSETFPFATPIGVGLIDSAINLTRLCLMSPPKFILFVGSAGSYGKLNIFDIVESKTAINVESSFLQNNSYTPVDNAVSCGESSIVTNSTNYITKSKDISKLYMGINADIENMEYYSIIKVAKEFEIPCGGVFVVTNYCYEDAHEEFLKNHEEAKKRLIEYLKERS